MPNAHWCFTLLVAMAMWLTTADAQDPIGVVDLLKGRADVTRGGEPARALAEQESLFKEDVVRTKSKSRIEMLLKDGSRLSLGESSRLVLADYAIEGGPRGLFNLVRGRLRSLVTDTFSRRRNAFRVQTKTATMGVQGTDFLTHALARSTRVSVFEGIVAVRNVDPLVVGEQTLIANQFTIVNEGEPPSPPTAVRPSDAAVDPNSGGRLGVQSDGLQAQDPSQIGPGIPAAVRVPAAPNPPGRPDR